MPLAPPSSGTRHRAVMACWLWLVTTGWVAAAAPTAIRLSSATLKEGCPPLTVVGELSAVDANVTDSHYFALVQGEGGNDNAIFCIVGNQLMVWDGRYLDFEARPVLSIRVRVIDSTALRCEQVFPIEVTDDLQEDCDADGLSQSEEQFHATSDLRFDTDGDGFGDPTELAAGTSPIDPASWPAGWIVGWGNARDGGCTVPHMTGFSAITTSQNHSLAIRLDGSVVAWGGHNDFGQNTVPAGLQDVVAVAAGGDDWPQDSAHSLALTRSGTVVAWGYDHNGQMKVPDGLTGVVAIAAGRSHCLALKNDGTVVAWGHNPFGSITPPDGLRDVVAIAAGGFYSMALKTNGSVIAWGSNFNGTQWQDVTVPVGLADVVAIAAGRFHQLALKADGTVTAWGYNLNGQTDVPAGLTDVVAIAAGGFHSLALKRDGTVVAWGLNGHDQTTLPVPAQTDVRLISAGILHSLALRRSPEAPEILSSPLIVSAPGEMISYQVALTHADEVAPSFSAIGLPDGLTIDPNTGLISGTVIAAARRSFEIRVLTSRGLITQAAWLKTASGQPPSAIILDSTSIMENSPAGTLVGTLSALDPDADDYHTFEWVDGPGSQDNDRFRIEGNQLVLNSPLTRDFEQNSSGFSIRIRARDASLNPYEQVIALVLLDDRSEDVDGDGLSEADEEAIYQTSDLLWDSDQDGFGDAFEISRGFPPVDSSGFPRGQMILAWGDNGLGQSQPPLTLQNITAVAAGTAHSLALTSNGLLATWGSNEDGQCTPPIGLHDIVAIAAGSCHSLALQRDGTVVAWGANDDGQVSIPADLHDVVAIAAGGRHSLALTAAGTVVAWGANYNGQASVPTGLTGVIAIAAGGYHSLALLGDGTVVAWGSTAVGAASVPADLTAVVAIAAGGHHSLALQQDGTVVAWGSNVHGQASVPLNLGSVRYLAAGEAYSAALRNDGSVIAWGDNQLKQTLIPPEANHLQLIAAGACHILTVRQDSSFPAFADTGPVRSWPGENLTYQVSIRDAIPLQFAALGLPADFMIHPDTGLISGTVTTGGRFAVNIRAYTTGGLLTQTLWFDTLDGVPPTTIFLNAGALTENCPAGTMVGTLEVIDPNAGDSHTLDLAYVSAAPDSFRFLIVGNQLTTRYRLSADYDAGQRSLLIRVIARDSGNNTLAKDFILQLSDDRSEDADGDGLIESVEEDIMGTKDSMADDFNSADPDRDGVPSLIEYAFNLDPKYRQPPVRLVAGADSTAGLPAISLVTNSSGLQHLRMEYIRRIGSAVVYTPEFASGLAAGDWMPASGPITTVPISSSWERCIVDDSFTTAQNTRRFGRVVLLYQPERLLDADHDGIIAAIETDLLGTSDDWFDDFNHADADADGMPSLIEYAFNLDPKRPGPSLRLATAATAGLPAIFLIADGAGGSRLCIEFLRRVDQRLVYTPEFAGSLNPPDWQAATRPTLVTPIDNIWERCHVEDSQSTSDATRRFARVSLAW